MCLGMNPTSSCQASVAPQLPTATRGPSAQRTHASEPDGCRHYIGHLVTFRGAEVKAVTTVRSKAIPLNRSNVDTDQIIPAKYLKRIERTGYGPFAFEAWRKDPTFVLNDQRYAGARILLARQNFGCGSSREHAVWAISELGVDAIVATSFADIFKSNCFQGGLLTVDLPEEDLDYLMTRAQELPAAEFVAISSPRLSAPPMALGSTSISIRLSARRAVRRHRYDRRRAGRCLRGAA